MDTPTSSASSQKQLPANNMSIHKLLNNSNKTISQLPTPDVSPEQLTINDLEDDGPVSPPTDASEDPLLYPPLLTSASTLSPATPLFSQESRRLPSPSEILAQAHRRPFSPPRSLSPHEETQWARIVANATEDPRTFTGSVPQNMKLQPTIWTLAARNPALYNKLKTESNRSYAARHAPRLNQLADLALRPAVPETPPVQKRKRVARPKVDVPQVAVSPAPSTPRQGPNRESRVRRKRPHENEEDASEGQSKRLRNQPRIKDKPSHFNKIPDYCPPNSILPDNMTPASEKAGAPVDVREMADDPHAHLLHPLELAFAKNQRLDCNKYLINKRLIFQAFTDSVIKGSTFSKTHAQQAGIIDVNKSSKIWEFFKLAGWFDHKLFDEQVERMQKVRREAPAEVPTPAAAAAAATGAATTPATPTATT